MNTVNGGIALATLLRWVMQIPSRYGSNPIPTTEDARAAAKFLVNKAAKSGACGLWAEDIDEHWPREAPARKKGVKTKC